MIKKIYIINYLLILSPIFIAARPKSTIHPITMFNIMMGVSFVFVLIIWIIALYRKNKNKK